MSSARRTSGELTWAYGLVEEGAPPPDAAGPPGCGPPRVVPVGPGVSLLASGAPVPAYSAGTIEARLSDLDWVSEVALGHERVLEAAARGSSLVPLKLFTLFSTDERAVEELGPGLARLRASLSHLAGRDEWGLRIRLAPGGPAAAEERPGSGTAFLQARLARRDAKQRRGRAASEAAAAAHRELLAIAVDGALRDASAGTAPPLLEAAYLVERTRLPRFQAAAEALARSLEEAGCTMELTGPWPGYTFAESGR